MKKYYSPILPIFIFTLIFMGFLGFRLVDAQVYIPGCTGAGPYSTVTGQLCNNSSYYSPTTSYIQGCYGTNLYSTITGQYCSTQNSSYYSNTTYTNTYPTYPTTYPTTYPNTYQSSPLPSLSVGSSGIYVSAVQQDLKNQGFLFGNVDGSFGPITESAVVRYQQTYGLSATGIVDTDTYIKLGILVPSTQATYPITYPTQPTCPVTYVNGIAQYLCNNGTSTNYYGAPTITYITPTSGVIGSQVTIYGNGLANGIINFGGYPVTPSYSSSTQMTFTVPSTLNNCYNGGYCNNSYTTVGTGNYNIYVTNAGVNSNTLIFSVTGTSIYGNNIPTISYLSPTAGPIGRVVTINGSNFIGATVNFGGYIIPSTYISSTQINFVIPSSLNNCSVSGQSCTNYIPVNIGNTYNVYVTNNGAASNTSTFTITTY